MAQVHSILNDVTAVLAGMGVPTTSLIHTILLQEKYFVGHKFRFDGGYAVWLAEKNAVEVYEIMLAKWPMDPSAPETQTPGMVALPSHKPSPSVSGLSGFMQGWRSGRRRHPARHG